MMHLDAVTNLTLITIALNTAIFIITVFFTKNYILGGLFLLLVTLLYMFGISILQDIYL